MKKFLTNSGRFIGLTIAALLTTAAPAAKAVSQPASPVGLWDCVMSGNGQDGIIFLNFTADPDTNSGLPTFEGLYVQAGRKTIPTGRAGSTSTGRGSSSSATTTNLFGGGFINGSAAPVADNGGEGDWLADSRGHRGNWFFNSKGETVGSYYTVLNANARITNFFQTCIDEVLAIPLTNGSAFNIEVAFCFTNAVIVTNFPWGPAPDGEVGTTNLSFTNNNFTIGSIGITNNVSFVGKVVPGKRLTMVGTSAFGRFHIIGVPLAPITTALPVDGFFWTGTKVVGGVKFVEEFSLTASGIQNAYIMNGQGASYTYGSGSGMGDQLCLISSQKKIGFSVAEFPVGASTNGFVEVNFRGTMGTLKNTKTAISTEGVGGSTEDPDLIKFNASLSPFALP